MSGWDDGGPWGGGRKNNGPGRPEPQGTPPDFDEFLKKSQEKLKDWFGGPTGPGGGKGSGGGSAKGYILLGMAAFILWLSSGIFVVDTDELGVVMRFGKYHRSTTAGLSYHLPSPIETVIKPKVTRVNKVEVGYRSGSGFADSRKGSSLEEESLMLTGDENIVDINFEIQWLIKDAKSFLFNVRYPDDAVKQAAEAAMREVIGRTPIATTQTEGRVVIEEETKNLLQSILDSYETGIEIVRLQMLKADPPAEVIDAFRDVQTAKADRERMRNEAEVYTNDIVPKARGEAQQVIQDAMAYKQRVTSESQGEAARFVSVYNAYKQAEDVTKKRIYLETMEGMLKGVNKVIIDSKSGPGIVPYFPLGTGTQAKAPEPTAIPQVKEFKP